MGDAACGMAIDTYALSQAAWVRRMSKKPSVCYVTPRGGTAVSADPIQLLRGAPNKVVAQRFIDFLLSLEGQKLHCFKPGTPGGPKVYALSRPAVRRELYADKYADLRFEKNYDPYRSGSDFVYRSAWTGKYYGLISRTIKNVILDPSEELQQAWRAIIAAGGPEKVPEAMKEFNAFPVPYSDLRKAATGLVVNEKNTLLNVVRLQRSWSEQAIQHYRRAAELARQGK
jgi:spermidine/putrescine-binding protein